MISEPFCFVAKPCGNNSAVASTRGPRYDQHISVNNADCDVPYLTIVPAVVLEVHVDVIEDKGSVRKVEMTLSSVDFVFLLIPLNTVKVVRTTIHVNSP